METPSEWAKRFNRQKTDEEAGSPNPEAETVDSPASVAEFPSEPFQCPACGQLLAPSCRVCVACKHTIDPAEIARPREVALPVARAASTEPKAEPVRYPWRIFFAVLGISFLLALISEGLWGEQKAAVGNGRSTDPCRCLGVFRCAPAAHSPAIALGSGLDAAARRHLPLVPGPQKKAPVTRAVCGSGSGAGHSVPAFCVACIFPGQFDFLHRARPATRYRAKFPAQGPQDRRQFPRQDYQPSPAEIGGRAKVAG